MEGEPRTDTATDIAVVGDDADSIADRVREAGGHATAVDARMVDGADAVIAVGETSLLSLVRGEVEVPVLPVGVDAGIETVPESDLDEAIESLVAGDFETTEEPLLSVSVGDDRYAALMDVMVVTTEPAKISEFRVENQVGENTEVVDTVRADGVVVATSAGTPGYATAAGGPVLAPETRSVAVVPVGPFRVEQTHWVLELPASFTVAREEAAVSLLVDDEEVRSVPAHHSVDLAWKGSLPVVRTAESGPPFDRSEKSSTFDRSE